MPGNIGGQPFLDLQFFPDLDQAVINEPDKQLDQLILAQGCQLRLQNGKDIIVRVFGPICPAVQAAY
jgi:hypothetical protein